MLSVTYGPWYLQGRQFGLYQASQRPLGKLSSFYSFYVFIDLTHIFLFSSFLFYIYISCLLLYISSVCLYSLLFHLLCVTNRSQTVQTVTEQRTNIDVDVEYFLVFKFGSIFITLIVLLVNALFF